MAASTKARIALAVTLAVSAKGRSLSTLGPSSRKPHERSCIEILTHVSAGVSGGGGQTGRGAVAASAKARIAPFVSAILHALPNLSKRSHMETLIIHKLGSIRLTTQNEVY